MTENHTNGTDAGDHLPQRDGSGSTAPYPAETEPDSRLPGTPCAGEENPELSWAKKHVPEDRLISRPVRQVFRKTELHGSAPLPGRRRPGKRRKKSGTDPGSPGASVPYTTSGEFFRDVVFPFMERQDAREKDLLRHCADLRQQIDALRKRVAGAAAGTAPDTGAGR